MSALHCTLFRLCTEYKSITQSFIDVHLRRSHCRQLNIQTAFVGSCGTRCWLWSITTPKLVNLSYWFCVCSSTMQWCYCCCLYMLLIDYIRTNCCLWSYLVDCLCEQVSFAFEEAALYSPYKGIIYLKGRRFVRSYHKIRCSWWSTSSKETKTKSMYSSIYECIQYERWACFDRAHSNYQCMRWVLVYPCKSMNPSIVFLQERFGKRDQLTL